MFGAHSQKHWLSWLLLGVCVCTCSECPNGGDGSSTSKAMSFAGSCVLAILNRPQTHSSAYKESLSLYITFESLFQNLSMPPSRLQKKKKRKANPYSCWLKWCSASLINTCSKLWLVWKKITTNIHTTIMKTAFPTNKYLISVWFRLVSFNSDILHECNEIKSFI